MKKVSTESRFGSGDLAILTTAFLWGFGVIAVKHAIGDTPDTFRVFVFNGLRLPFVSLLLFGVVKLRGKSIAIRRSHLPLVLTVAFFGIFLNTVTAIWGLSLTTATNMGIITSTTPLFILIVSFVSGTEHISKKLATGLLVGIGGVILINYRQGELAWNTGDILVMLSCLCFAVYAVFGKKIVDIYSAVLTTAWMFLLAGIYQFPLFSYQLGDQEWNTITMVNWIYFIVGTFGSFFAANVLFFHAIRKIGAVRAGLYLNLQPVFTLIFAYFLMGETITVMKVIGLTIILVGIGITKIPPRIRPV